MFGIPPLKDLQTFPQRLREGGRVGVEWLRDMGELLFGPRPGLVLQDLLVRRRLGLALAWLVGYGWAIDALGVGYLLCPWPEGSPAVARLLNAVGFVVWVGLWMGLATLIQWMADGRWPMADGPDSGSGQSQIASRQSPIRSIANRKSPIANDWLGLCLLWSYTYLPLALLRIMSPLWQDLAVRLVPTDLIGWIEIGLIPVWGLLLGRWIWLMQEALAVGERHGVRSLPTARRQVRWQWPLLVLVGLTAGIGWWMGVCASYNLDPEVHQQLGQGDVTRMTTDLFTLRLRPPRPGEVIVFETLTPVLEGPWISHGSGAPKPPPPVRLHPYARPRFARWTWQLGLSVSYGSRSVGRVTGREPGGWVVVSSLAEPPGPERLRVPQERVIGKVVWVR